VHKVGDLKPGMVLEGVVTNVAAFGAFVDVGVHQDGLVHVSAMSDRFVSDPHEVVRSGQVVRVKVLDVDVDRQRISLSLRLKDEAGAGRKPAGRTARVVSAAVASGASKVVVVTAAGVRPRPAVRWPRPCGTPVSAADGGAARRR
jgi:transcriptional accessory protein Tex/SPT6